MKKITFTILLLITITITYAQKPVPYLLNNGRYVYVEFGSKNVIIDKQFDDAMPFFEDFACVKKKDKWGVINKDGEIVIPIEHENISKSKNGIIHVDEVYYNSKLEKLDFNLIVDFSEGYAIIEKQETLNKEFNYYIIDSTLNYVTKLDTNISQMIREHRLLFYENKKNPIVEFSGGYFRINLKPTSNEKELKYNYINLDGKLLLEENYALAENFKNGLAKVGKVTKEGEAGLYVLWGYINTLGEEYIPLRYDKLGNFSEGLAFAEIGSGAGYIDTTGAMKISFDSDYTGGDFNSGLATSGTYNRGGFRGYIDKNGRLKIKFASEIESFQDFSDGLAAIRKDRKWGFIKPNGFDIIIPKFNNVTKFTNGYAIAKEGYNGGISIINKNGRQISANSYDFIIDEFLDNEIMKDKIDGKYLFFPKSCNKKRNVNVQTLFYNGYEYSKNYSYELFKNELERVELSGQQFYVDKNGFEYFQK
jgi:hypothetical protein